MDPSLIAILALIASAIQVGLLRAIDYYFPRGHTHVGDHMLEEKAARNKRRKKSDDNDDDECVDEDLDVTDPDE